jgi:alkylation response protein AidB-like acyl-CoA dehydrogenase
MLQVIEEYAAECSLVKIFSSEMLDYVVDEGVQIHGGYGYHQDFGVERAYRDSRINRIFEGTNEINRLVMAGMLLKRAARGRLALIAAVNQAQAETQSEPADSDAADEEDRLVRNAKKIALLSIGFARERYGESIEKQQEVLMGIADLMMEAFAMESVRLRARKLDAAGKGAQASDVCAVFLRDAMARVEITAREVGGACAQGNDLRKKMAAVRRLAFYEPVDSIELRQKVARRLLERGRYTLG